LHKYLNILNKYLKYSHLNIIIVESAISKRFKSLINVKTDGNKSLFERKCGLKPNALGAVFSKSQSNPGLSTINAVLTTFPDISRDWLINGTGSMYGEVEEGPKLGVPEETISFLKEELERYRKREDLYIAQLTKLEKLNNSKSEEE
jgi:hypothetical protein